MAFLAALGVATVLSGVAGAQAVRPTVKGRAHKVKVDSSPQQAAVYWDSGTSPDPKKFGIAGYTPITVKVPRGGVRFIVELQGFKAQDKTLDIKKSQTVNFTLERAPSMAKLDLQSTTDGTAVGADVKIDGVGRGSLPNSFDLAAGRHQVEINKAGFKPWSDWFDLGEGEHRTRDVSLTKAEAPGGALLVTSDGGGDVYVDGVRKDVAPTMIEGVAAGDHIVEVKKDGATPWRQTVTVVSGQQTKVAATFGASSTGGALRVIASEPDTEVFVDGEDKGRAPASVTGLATGEHVVEGRRAKFKTVQQTVRVAAGESAVVQLKMEVAPPDRPHASLKVQSAVPNAEVFVDGSSLGRAPVDRSDLDPGKHYVVVHKDGYTDFKREVVLLENQAIALVADLSATGTLRALSSPEGADVRVDGELIGKTPVVREGVSVGSHLVEVDLKGYFKHKDTVKIDGGREYLYSADLQLVPTGPTPEQQAKRKMGMSSYGAKVNPVGGVTTDFGIGYPYWIMARATVGAFNVKPLGLDLGVEFQTFFQIYDFSVHGRLQLVETGPLSIAARANVGGGFGGSGRNTYFADLSPIISLAFSNVATVSASARWSLWTDRFCPSATEVQAGVGFSDFCKDPASGVAKDPAANASIFGTGPDDRRFSGQRLLIGFAAVAAIDRLTSVFLHIEFLPELAPAGRPAFTHQVNGALFDKDTLVYGTAGVELKF
ncbi:MAG TPA: PEGA domain-containing protein [Polyangia bacterium]|nr:PEGA domain-containing protein [Polyangia bacterium]